MNRYYLFILCLLLIICDKGFAQDYNKEYSGIITYYYDGLPGHCLFELSERPVYNGAMNWVEYDDGAACGTWVRITNPSNGKEIEAFIDNSCPGCKSGHIDLSPEAFAALQKLEDGRQDVVWRFIPSPREGNLQYRFDNESHQWHSAIQIRNHRYAITKVEVRNGDSGWINHERKNYNYWEYLKGMGLGNCDIRVTDIFGQVITEYDIPFIPNTVYQGQHQFPYVNLTSVSNYLAERNRAYSVHIFPNPVKDDVQLACSFPVINRIFSIKIYDITGTLVFANDYLSSEAGNNEIRIDGSGLRPGTYYTTLTVDQEVKAIARFYKIQ